MALRQRGMEGKCEFCRTPTPKDEATAIAMVKKRVNAGDSGAMNSLAVDYFNGNHGLEKDAKRAFELWTEAADLGSIEAHFELGVYADGIKQDTMAVAHWERAAIKGHVLEVTNATEGITISRRSTS